MSAPGEFDDLPPKMREALERQTPEFARECAESYRAADEESKADILAFFESEGPRVVHEVKLKYEDGTPTSEELEGWSKGGPL